MWMLVSNHRSERSRARSDRVTLIVSEINPIEQIGRLMGKELYRNNVISCYSFNVHLLDNVFIVLR